MQPVIGLPFNTILNCSGMGDHGPLVTPLATALSGRWSACSNVTLEDVSVLGECCPSSPDSYLNLLVLVFISGAVSLSQVDLDVDFNTLDLSIVDISCVGSHHHRCLRHVRLRTLIFTFIS